MSMRDEVIEAETLRITRLAFDGSKFVDRVRESVAAAYDAGHQAALETAKEA